MKQKKTRKKGVRKVESENQGKAVTRSVVNRLQEVRQEIAKHEKALEELRLEKRAIKTQIQGDEQVEVDEDAAV